MKCPILSGWFHIEKHDIKFIYNPCLREECAWWDEERFCCLIRTLSKKVVLIAEEIKLTDVFKTRAGE